MLSISRTLMFQLAVAFLSLLPSTANPSFPGPPLALDQLWVKSTVVGLAQVTVSKRVDNETHVSFTFKKFLKNTNDSPSELDAYTLLGGCPYPFGFKNGQCVLVFLAFDGDRKLYRPVGAAEAAIEVDDELFLLYAKLLKELPAILSGSDERQANRDLLKWYIKCSVSPRTRSDGAWGISSLCQRNKAKLTEAQSLEIAKILTAEQPPQKSSAALFEQISKFPNDQIDLYLLESLRRSHEVGWSDLTRPAIDHLPERLGLKLGTTTENRLEEYWDLLGDVYYGVDDDLEDDQEPTSEQLQESFRDKELLAVFWGSLSYEIYKKCKTAIDKRNK